MNVRREKRENRRRLLPDLRRHQKKRHFFHFLPGLREKKQNTDTHTDTRREEARRNGWMDKKNCRAQCNKEWFKSGNLPEGLR